jgi:hypothetical protein
MDELGLLPKGVEPMQQGTLSLFNVIEQVSQEKGIDPQILIEATEQAILTAAKRTFGADRELEARFNHDTGWVDLFQYMTVVDEVDNEEREISVGRRQASRSRSRDRVKSWAFRSSTAPRTRTGPASRTRSSAICST